MIAFLRRNPLIALLAAGALVLLVVIGFETRWGTRFAPKVPASSGKPAASVEAKVLPTVVASSADQAYPETVSRPLFTPTRRPAPAAPVASAQKPRGTMTLVGTTIAGGLKIAMLKERGSGRVHRVEEGKEVNGMPVVKIEPDRVVLGLGGDGQEVVSLLVQKAGSPPSAVAPQAAAGPFPGAAPPQAAPGTAAVAGAPTRPPLPGTQSGTPPPTATPPPAVPPELAGFGPRLSDSPGQPQGSATALTPEELLARRRARRQQQ